MWIDRLEFIGFGNLTGQRIDFPKNKLSVITQGNEYGKSTICESIRAILYGYPPGGEFANQPAEGGEKQPLSGAAYKACMDITVRSRPMRLIKDFAAQSIKVLDLDKDPSKADSDITQEFAALLAEGRLGEHLTSLDRRLFQTVCLVSQNRSHSAPFVADRALAGLLLDTAGSGATAGNVFDAIAALEEKLHQFPFRDKPHDVDGLIAEMESDRKSLADDLRRLESERLSCDRDVEQLSAVEDRLQVRMKVVTADEYFQLCLELAEVEDRLSRAQERIEKIIGLTKRLAALTPDCRLDDQTAAAINQMWLRRQSRITDLGRLQSEAKEKLMQRQIRDLENRMLGENLDSLSQDDAHMLSALSRSLQEVLLEIEDTQRKHDEESRRVKSQGIDMETLEHIRRSLLCLEPKELDELHSLHSTMVTARERANEYLLSAEKAVTTVNEIMHGRQLLIRMTLVVFCPLMAFGCFFLILMLTLIYGMHESAAEPRVAVCTLLWAFACAGSAAAWYAGKRIGRLYRDKEEGGARLIEQKCQIAAQELDNKVTACQSRIEGLSAKANLQSGEQLVKTMQDYSVSSSQLKELDFLDYLLRNQQMRAQKLRQQMKPYFAQAKRDNEEITAESAGILAQDVARFVAARQAGLQASTGEHRASEIRFISDELQDEDRLIIKELANLNITGFDVEEAYARFQAVQSQVRNWQALNDEIERLTDEASGELSQADLVKLVERLEAKRASIWARMQQLIGVNPDIANMAPPASDGGMVSQDTADLKLSVEKLKHQRDELTVQIRAAMKNYQDNYLKSLEKLEAVEQDLEHLRHCRASLHLARDTFLQLAAEHHAVWADRLNEIAGDLLKQAAMEYDSLEFDADLNLSARRKGQREPFTDWQMHKQVSQGSRQQLNFVARLAVSQFLSQRQPLPLILDEPFADIDDERFVKNMRLLLNAAAPDKQIIVLSCHQRRHQWLIEQLSAAERGGLEICRLVPLKADAGSFARR